LITKTQVVEALTLPLTSDPSASIAEQRRSTEAFDHFPQHVRAAIVQNEGAMTEHIAVRRGLDRNL